MLIHPNATKHGVGAEQIRQAYETGSGGARVLPGDEDDEPVRWATIGFDGAGRSIELVFVRGVDGSVLGITANRMTKRFLAKIMRT